MSREAGCGRDDACDMSSGLPQTHHSRDRSTRRAGGGQRLVVAICLMVFVMSVSPTASAYLDPGTAYMALQWLLGLIAGLGAAMLVYWQRITAAWTRWSGRASREERVATSKAPDQAAPSEANRASKELADESANTGQGH